MKKYYRFIPMIVTLLLFGYFYLYKHVYKNNNYFYQNEIHSKIIKVENYYDKSLQFYYTPEYCITTSNTKGDTLKTGDSISKKSHTHTFDIYRMRNDRYEFYKRYE